MKKFLAYARKAFVGPVLGLLGAAGQYLITGHLDQHVLITAGVGILGGLVTYFVKNSGPEVAAAEAVFAPVSAGHPDPEPPVLALVAQPPAPPAESTDAPAPAAPPTSPPPAAA